MDTFNNKDVLSHIIAIWNAEHPDVRADEQHSAISGARDAWTVVLKDADGELLCDPFNPRLLPGGSGVGYVTPHRRKR